jgi:hypothetical protein
LLSVGGNLRGLVFVNFAAALFLIVVQIDIGKVLVIAGVIRCPARAFLKLLVNRFPVARRQFFSGDHAKSDSASAGPRIECKASYQAFAILPFGSSRGSAGCNVRAATQLIRAKSGTASQLPRLRCDGPRYSRQLPGLLLH